MALRRFLPPALILLGVCIAPALAQDGRQGAGGGGASEQRLDRIEEQIVDLQSQAAALESLAGSGGAQGGAPDGGGFAGGDSGGRAGALESQVQALSNQMSEIMRRLQQMEAQLGIRPSRGDAPPPQGQPQFAGRQPQTGQPQTGPQPPQNSPGRAPSSFDAERPGASGPGGFGATVEPERGGQDGPQRPGGADGRRYAGAPQGGDAYGGGRDSFGGGRDPGASQPARYSSGEARALYDQAYSSLVKREYQAAETYFTQFIKQHPDDPLAGPAQFWLGETAFVAGEYRRAADMFLKSYTSYPASDKAPESLLKLGISLKRLGETSAACDTFSELERKFPQTQAVLTRAQQEKRRSNC